MQVPVEFYDKKIATLAALQMDRQPWWTHWRDLADYYLPRRYVWLMSPAERNQRANSRNQYILDPTGTQAARTLASGMMNGITSPARPWFKMRATGFSDDIHLDARKWLDEVQRRMMLVMAESNFYNSLAVLYLDLVVFGTAANLIYEDYDSVIRCYNSPLGEYYLGQDDRQVVNYFGREFSYKVHQLVQWFGLENCSEGVKQLYKEGGGKLHQDRTVCHLIEPNSDEYAKPSKNFKYRELYWEKGAESGQMLAVRGYHELPGVFPRWELTANDSYGSSPAMDALGDVIQLQHETKKKAQGLDKMIDPPIIADIQLEHKPMALLPRGITYVAGTNNVGAKPVYTVQLPLDQMTMDIRDVQGRIRETFHNDLFKMISQLDTVRSATEIDARREEKLVLLGSVLERFENEALDPAIRRIYAIMERGGLLPEPPEELVDANLEIEYMSILTAAQTAVSAIPTERWMQVIANIAPIYPKAINIPNWEELIRNYGRDVGVEAKNINPPDVTQELNDAADSATAEQEAAVTGEVLVNSAKQLSETDVGGGANALQRIIGG